MLRQAVILVGSKDTRLGKQMAQMPRPLLEVGGRPFLDCLVWHYARHGLTDILLLVRHCGEEINKHYRNKSILNAKITVIMERESLGTAGALKFIHDQLDETFILVNGDSFFDFNVLALLDGIRNVDWLAKLALHRVKAAQGLGIIRLSSNGRIISYQEECALSGSSALINSGVYLLRKEIVTLVDKTPCSLETGIFPHLVAEEKLLGQEFSGYFINIDESESYQKAQDTMLRRLRRPAVFFDRDGTLNRDEGYTHKPEDLEWLPGAPEAIRYCNDHGYYVFVVTNQSGVARGYYDEVAIRRFHAEMQRQLQAHGAHIDDFAYCPHHPNGVVRRYARVCGCRKPETGMLSELAERWPINMSKSLLLGDRESDVICAQNFGIAGIKVSRDGLYRKIIEEIGGQKR